MYGVSAQKTYTKDKSRVQDQAEQNRNQRIDPVFERVLPTEAKYMPQPEDFWRRLIEFEKECNFENITAEELLISKFMTAITDKKLRDKLMNEKKPAMKKAVEMIKQNTYEKTKRKIIKTQYRKH